MNKLIKRNLENTHCNWWLRSANFNNGRTVGYVYNYGYISYDYADNYTDDIPVCQSGICPILEI